MDLMSFDDDVNTSLRPDPQNHPSPHSDVSNEDINALLSQQAEELFHACDRQNNNYITKNDLHQLVAILPLSEEQLDAVFDSLDDDKNGQLTLDEFTHGFGSFMGVPPKDVTDPFMTEERVYEITDDPDDYEANQRFQQMLEETGAVDVLPDMSTVKMLWSRLSKMEPEMLGNLEDFVYKISHNLKHTTTEFNSLQTALKSKSTEHDAEIQKLYEEMELQIRQEKDRVLSEEKAKERTLRDQMEKEIKDKDSQLQEIMNKHQNLESRLMDLNLSEVETKQENDRLQKERQNLEKMLMDSQQDLAESQVYISNIKHTQKEENRERARSALKVTEGIVLERESLIKQLDMLRDMNKKLRDEQDVAEACQPADFAVPPSHLNHRGSTLAAYYNNGGTNDNPDAPPLQGGYDLSQKRGSVMSNYVESSTPKRSSRKHSGEENGFEYENAIQCMDMSPVRENHARAFTHVSDLQECDDDIECDDELVDDGLPEFGENLTNHGDEFTRESFNFRESLPRSRQSHTPLAFEDAQPLSSSSRMRNYEIGEMFAETLGGADGPNGDLRNFPGHESHESRMPHYGHDGRQDSRPGETHDDNVTSEEVGGLVPTLGRRHKYTHVKGERKVDADVITSSDTEGGGQANRRTRRPRKKASPACVTDPPVDRDRLMESEQELSPLSMPATRYQPVGASPNVSAEIISSSEIAQDSLAAHTPQRLFKVVFVGDSGVGKSSFIHRFCNNQFKTTFSTTIGVDFQVRSVVVDKDIVALQLWDTAGQERFRSITKQYFRKADGVLIMYDIACELSFTNIRNWMSSVADGVEEGTALVVIGNKIDLATDENSKSCVTQKSGRALAESYKAMFYETSAKSGHNVVESMLALASVLKEKEDLEMEKAITLEETTMQKKKGCCKKS